MKQFYNALMQMEALLFLFIILICNIQSKILRKQNINTLEKDMENNIKYIQSYVYSFAENISRKSNIDLKRKVQGDLPDSYPERMKIRAKKLRENKSNFMELMDIPLEPWRFCIYPQAIFKLNINKYCEQKFSHSKLKLFGCKNSYCNFCCDNSNLILKRQSKRVSKLSKILSVHSKFLTRVIKDIDIQKCKKKCNEVHKVNYPIILPPPPRNNKLGTSIENSAKSCSDIKKWGNENSKSGEYWIEYGSKLNKVKVFCDMETDGGGWTLFFNYVHFPGQEITIDSSKIPTNLHINSHINLKDLDYIDNDVKELRFFCTERSKDKRFIHFKISNLEIINLALTGDQKSLKKSNNFITNSITDLKLPNLKDEIRDWKRVIGKSNVNMIDTMNESSNGGFWDTPFGSKKEKLFWTVKGNVTKGGRFECGSHHSNGEDDNLIQSHHSVWFRGPVLSVEEARERFTLYYKK